MERERVLVTGGTGYLGSHIVKALLEKGKHVISFARGEHDHERQQREIPTVHHSRLESFIGDVRDPDALFHAFKGVGLVYHAAAQKCVPWSEQFPEECIKTNVQGTINVQKAAEEAGVKRAILISSDKACRPINTYGASKYLAERVWKGQVIRLGNIWGSTGSVIYWLLKQRGTGEIKITSMKMRRWHIRVDQAVQYVLACVHELSIPTMRWYWLEDLAKAVDPDAKIVETGIRKGEKQEEDLYESGTAYPEYLRMSVDELRTEIETLCGSGVTAATPR